MRALRILLIVVVVLGGLFVIADRVAVHFAESEAADKVRTSEGLADTPDVSIKGFPFLTQAAGGTLDDVEIGIQEYDAKADGNSVHITDLRAEMRDVKFDSSYSSATAGSATGTAHVSYDELLKAVAQQKPAPVAPGITAKITGLAYGGPGKVKVTVTLRTPLGSVTPTVLSTVKVVGGKVSAHADSLPKVHALDLAENRVRAVTDFRQAIDNLPAGISLDNVEPGRNGVEISVKGSDLKLVG
ncbi:LmeA family phospholipid-binding protein [Streptomyces beihaiensis]|uniref:DUF2993 domain-containing protein n=1 Tax=Streptomyces beihaiensis TaxID=2984495 RepID=A0ABT3TSX0_9ACTN|nr:DUF2993 domain-containing protein [Streptomyces beihaiensis]MCX3059113.1 DUF2993 domain-containing protein [Streptomyces beihaiensis]